MKKINIAIFTGGSGNLELARNLSALNKKTKNISINFIINGYDDGKSTGFLRKLVPGMLGPSDFRKNCSNLLTANNQREEILKKIIEFRIKDFGIYKQLIKKLEKKDKYQFNFIDHLPWNKYLNFIELMKLFHRYLKKQKFNEKEFLDVSLGNIIFTAIFLKKNNNFNSTIRTFSKFFEIDHNLYNVTDGKNLFLCALASSGSFLKDEVSIIENKKKEKISEIFLLKKKLDPKKIEYLNNFKTLEQKIQYLSKMNYVPSLNADLKLILKKADVIIYGPGTQNSSLFPSYLTKNLNKYLVKSKAKKIFISNIIKDKDIIHETADSLINSFFYYMNKEKKVLNKNRLIDYYFLHRKDLNDINNINEKAYLTDDLKVKGRIFKFDWEKSSGVHFSNLIVSQIFKIMKMQNFFEKNRSFQSVSIIMPCLNEKNKLSKVLNKISNFRVDSFNPAIELIFVDGGSSDGSVKIAKKFKNLKIYALKNKKRGECIDFGIKNSKGDIIVIFPTDGEYLVSDIPQLIDQIYLKKSEAVFGSRLIKNLDPSKMIKKVYGKNLFLYYVSKFGGIGISVITLILYNRFLADPLTTFKCFNSRVVKNLNIKAKGVNYDLEQYLKLYENRVYVDEQPVNYKARSYKDGKKTNFIDGLGCIMTLIKYKFFRLI